MPLTFTPSLPVEAPILSEIAIRSKGHWGYSAEQLESWRDGLRIEPAYIEKNLVRSIRLSGQTIGFFAIVKGSPDLLDHLWILPSHIGNGYGSRAIATIKDLCIQNEITNLLLLSDPHAETFYLRHGATRVGEVYSAAQDKMLPQLSLPTLAPKQNKRP